MKKGRGQVQCAAAENGKVVTCSRGLYRLDTPGAGTEGEVSGVKCCLRKSLHSVRQSNGQKYSCKQMQKSIGQNTSANKCKSQSTKITTSNKFKSQSNENTHPQRNASHTQQAANTQLMTKPQFILSPFTVGNAAQTNLFIYAF